VAEVAGHGGVGGVLAKVDMELLLGDGFLPGLLLFCFLPGPSLLLGHGAFGLIRSVPIRSAGGDSEEMEMEMEMEMGLKEECRISLFLPNALLFSVIFSGGPFPM
jgi:hypothetical protein